MLDLEKELPITGFEPVTCRLKVGSSDQTELYGFYYQLYNKVIN